MAISFLSRLFGGKDKNADTVATPDISRVFKSAAKTPAPVAETADQPNTTETIDIDLWMTADIEALCETWAALYLSPEDEDARSTFARALHNLHGASGAYGGGALTRLCNSLEELLAVTSDIAAEAPLINLLVQACHAATLGDQAGQLEVAEAICESLEERVAKRKASIS